MNATLPKGKDPQSVTVEEALALINERAEKAPAAKGKAKATKTAKAAKSDDAGEAKTAKKTKTAAKPKATAAKTKKKTDT